MISLGKIETRTVVRPRRRLRVHIFGDATVMQFLQHIRDACKERVFSVGAQGNDVEEDIQNAVNDIAADHGMARRLVPQDQDGGTQEGFAQFTSIAGHGGTQAGVQPVRALEQRQDVGDANGIGEQG